MNAVECLSRLAGVAQLVEQLIRNQQVTRSSRVAGSRNLRENSTSRLTILKLCQSDTLSDTHRAEIAVKSLETQFSETPSFPDSPSNDVDDFDDFVPQPGARAGDDFDDIVPGG